MLFVFLSLKNHISDVKIIHFEELVDARFNNASGTDGCKVGKQYKARNNGHGKMVVLLLLTFCLLLLQLWESVIVLCFVVRYFMSILVLQSS